MRKIIFFICYILSAVSYAQRPEDASKFKVVDKATGQPVPYTPISLLRAKMAIATEGDGVFYLPGNLANMRDTIIFSAQNYNELKLPIYKLAAINVIELTKKVATKSTATTLYSAKKVLNDHFIDDIGNYAGMSTGESKFNYLQIAQHFVTNAQNSRLTNITIHKRKHWMRTKFRIRIYDVDPATGGPGFDLHDQIIDIDNEQDVNDYLNRRPVEGSWGPKGREDYIDLTKYNIVIPNKSFFVAVEWIRDFLNAAKAPIYNAVSGKIDTAIVFRPYIGLSPVQGNKLNVWVMEVDRKWKLYDHFYPVGTDLAIKTTVVY